MLKQNTIGVVGESLFIKLLKENNIDFTDLRNYQRIQTIHVNKREGQPEYLYLGKLHTHPFDFVVGGLNIEIKTSTIHKWDNKITFSWKKNDRKNIDYVVGLVINKERKLKTILLFDNKYINTYVAFSAKHDGNLKFTISQNDLLKLFKNNK